MPKRLRELEVLRELKDLGRLRELEVCVPLLSVLQSIVPFRGPMCVFQYVPDLVRSDLYVQT
jgi:hypothetical protein